MVIRRIVTGVCALCLATPAAAIASPGTDSPKAQGPYGVVAVHAPLTGKVKGPYGVTPATGPVLTGKVKGPYGVTPATGPVLTGKVKGPYGVTSVAGPAIATGRTTHLAVAARSDATTGWRTAAISEAALLAALALGFVGLAGARRRAPRMVA